MKPRISRRYLGLALLALCVGGLGPRAIIRMGRQPDGSFYVSSGQHIEGGSLAFPGRPIDLALHPSGEMFAVLNKGGLLLGSSSGIRPESEVKLDVGSGFRGLAWSPDGTRLFA